jgi:hypothetical protein
MGGRDRVDIPKRCHLVVAMNNLRFDFLGNNLTENTGICHFGSHPGKVG